MLKRIGAGDLDVIGVEHIVDGKCAACDGILEYPGQRGAGLHGAGDEFDILVIDRPQLIFDLLVKLDGRRLEPRLRPRFGVLRDANPARPDVLQRGMEVRVQRKPLGIPSADQNALAGNFMDRGGDHTLCGLNLDLEMAGQRCALAPRVVLALAQQYRAAGFEFRVPAAPLWLRVRRRVIPAPGFVFQVGAPGRAERVWM